MKTLYGKATAPDGKTIMFGVRSQMFLLLQCNFNPMEHISFFEIEIKNIESIGQMNSIGTYPDGSGYVIYGVRPMLFNDQQQNQLITTFKNHFAQP